MTAAVFQPNRRVKALPNASGKGQWLYRETFKRANRTILFLTAAANVQAAIRKERAPESIRKPATKVHPYWGLCRLFNVLCDRGLVDQSPYVAGRISDLPGALVQVRCADYGSLTEVDTDF